VQAQRRVSILLALLLILPTALGCRPGWELAIVREGDASITVSAEQWRDWARDYPQETQSGQALALERVLWEAGVPALDGIRLAEQQFGWVVAHGDAWLLRDGKVRVGEQTFDVDEIAVIPPTLTAQVRLIDLAPTLAGALGVRSPAATRGRALAALSAERVIVVAIDGLSYIAYSDVRSQNVTVILDTLGVPKLTLSSYPSTPEAATQAILTGAYSAGKANDTVPETLFDVLASANRSGVAIVPESLDAALGQARQIVVTRQADDEDLTTATIDTALALLDEQPPNLLWLHLDGLSRAAATHGLSTDESTARLHAIDEQLQRVVTQAPTGSLLFVVGTHGIHPTDDAATLAEGGSLLASDMLVPLWMVEL